MRMRRSFPSTHSLVELLKGRVSCHRWVFDLNPELPWSELSRETKQRLRVLPKEAVSECHLEPACTPNCNCQLHLQQRHMSLPDMSD